MEQGILFNILHYTILKYKFQSRFKNILLKNTDVARMIHEHTQ